MGQYHAAQICLNGHVIASRFDPRHPQKFCSDCGESTTTQCDRCGAEIRGALDEPGVIDYLSTYVAPAFCHDCGQPYAWTARRMEAARELADEMEELSEAERQTLKQCLDDLVRDTPRTELAGIRYKKVMRKVSRESNEAMKNMLIDLISESVRKALFGLQ